MQMERLYAQSWCVCIISTWRPVLRLVRIADVSGAASLMRIMRRICGCGWCIAHVLVVACSACAGAPWVDVMKRRIAVCTYAWVRCRFDYRIQGAGCRWIARRVSDAASVHRILREHDCALPAQYTKQSNVLGASLEALYLGSQLGWYNPPLCCIQRWGRDEVRVRAVLYSEMGTRWIIKLGLGLCCIQRWGRDEVRVKVVLYSEKGTR